MKVVNKLALQRAGFDARSIFSDSWCPVYFKWLDLYPIYANSSRGGLVET